MSAYKEATVLVIGALAGMPGFDWDDDDLADCAQVAVNALEAAGWGPIRGSCSPRTIEGCVS